MALGTGRAGRELGDLTGPRDCSSGDWPEYPALAATAVAVAKDGKVLIGGYSVCDTVLGRYRTAPDNDPGPPLRLDT